MCIAYSVEVFPSEQWLEPWFVVEPRQNNFSRRLRQSGRGALQNFSVFLKPLDARQ